MVIEFLRSLVRIRLVGSTFWQKKSKGIKGKEKKSKKKESRERVKQKKEVTVIHCGVVGNIQAFHVCAPGSIPGDGVFLSFFFSFFDTFISPFFFLFMDTDHSSVGRAEDCSW